MMTLLLVLVATQADASAADAAGVRFSILASPCAPATDARPDDVVVCGRADPARLPLRTERGPPDQPRPINPDRDPRVALAATAPVCAAVQGGCPAAVNIPGMGTAAVRLVQKLVAPGSCCEMAGEATDPIRLAGDAAGAVKRIFARRPDRSNRVAIDLDAPPPAGRLLP